MSLVVSYGATGTRLKIENTDVAESSGNIRAAISRNGTPNALPAPLPLSCKTHGTDVLLYG